MINAGGTTMKCFVTGATGHIGNVLVKRLFELGHSVDALVLKGDDYQMIEPYANLKFGDITDRNYLTETVKGYDIVYHLAGVVEIRVGRKKQLYKINVEGTKNLLDACSHNRITKFLYVSSVHAIKETPKGSLIKEPDILNPGFVKGHYAKTKAIATDLVLNYPDKALKTIVVYPSGIIGPYDYKLSNFGQVFVDHLIDRLPAYVEGGYNFVDVRDAAEGIISASLKGRDRQDYILSGHNISVKELLDKISLFEGKKIIKTKIATWFMKTMSYFAEMYYAIMKRTPLFTHYSIAVLNSNYNFDCEKARRELNFKTRDIDSSIIDTIEFLKVNFLVKSKNKYRMKLTN